MSGKSKYRIAKDRLPARVSGPWAEEKLEILRRYMSTVTTAMKNSQWKGCCYIDLLAGCGRCILEGSDHEFDGSPLIALKCEPAFKALVFVEADRALVAALKTRTTTSALIQPEIIPENCNDSATIGKIRNAVPTNMLGICFVDNLGWDVSLSAISRIVASRQIDLVVTFQESAFTRNVSRAFKEPKISAQFDSALGTGWRNAVAAFEAKKTSAPDVAAALADYYTDRLKRLGYNYATRLNDPMKNRMNATLYRLVSFSKHPLGGKLFGAVSKSVAAPRLDFG